VGDKCAVECVCDALRKEAEHLDEVGWHTRAQHFFDAADALDALNETTRREHPSVGAEPRSVGVWVGFRAAYADRMMHAVVR
jgi:hypothetical protein